MTIANFKIVVIVSRSDFDGASAIFHIGVFVGDDGYFPVGEREMDGFAD